MPDARDPRRRAEHAEDLRLSYPDAGDEDITAWVWGDTEPPPLLRTRPDRFWDQPPDEPDLYRLRKTVVAPA